MFLPFPEFLGNSGLEPRKLHNQEIKRERVDYVDPVLGGDRDKMNEVAGTLLPRHV